MLLVVQVMNDELLMTACLLCKLNAFFDFTMRLKQSEDSKVVNIIVVLMHKSEKLLLQNLDLLDLDHGLLSGDFFVHFRTIVDFMSGDCSDL